MQELHHFRYPRPSAAMLDVLRAHTAPTEWPPALILKLSGGGIVCRVMAGPETERAFFGVISAERIRLVVNSHGQEVTPFQPILFVTIIEDGDDGCTLSVKLRPHREARSPGVFFSGVSVLVALAALPAALSGDLTGLAGLVLGAAGSVFPRFRAQASFRADRDRALATLQQVLPDLHPLPDQASPDQSSQ